MVTLTSLWLNKSKIVMKETGDKMMMNNLDEQYESDLDDMEIVGLERDSLVSHWMHRITVEWKKCIQSHLPGKNKKSEW